MIRFQIDPATMMAVAARVVDASIEVLPKGAELGRLTVETDLIEAVIYGPDDVADAGARLLAHALGLTETRDHAYKRKPADRARVFRYRNCMVI